MNHTRISPHFATRGFKRSTQLLMLRYSYHMNCKVMRQRIAPGAVSPSSFYIKHLERAHPLCDTCGRIRMMQDKMCLLCVNIFQKIDICSVSHVIPQGFINTGVDMQYGFRRHYATIKRMPYLIRNCRKQLFHPHLFFSL